MILLILGMIYMFWEFNHINKQGLECHSNPFEYGKQEAEKQGLYCYYSCSRDIVKNAWDIKIDDFP